MARRRPRPPRSAGVFLGVALLAAGAATAALDQRLSERRHYPPNQSRCPSFGRLSPGTPAPDLELQPAAGGPAFSLAEHRGRRPVVLIFSSFT